MCSYYNVDSELYIEYLRRRDKDDETYFNKVMAYYSLESIHRMDYIYKLALYLEKVQHEKIDKDFIFSILFTPTRININSTDHPIKYENSSYREYYIPMLFHDKHYMDQYFNSEDSTLSASFHFNKRIRCLVFEMFNYYYEFESKDYADIKSFISEKYPVLSYFDTNKIWNYSYGDSENIMKLLNMDSIDIDKVDHATINLITRMSEVSKTIFTG